MKIETELLVSKSAPALWAVLGEQFGEAHLWASALTHTHGHGEVLQGQVCESRTCDVKGMGRIKERLRDFDPERFTLEYEVVEGFPFFVERGVNRWTLIVEGQNETRVRSVATITTRGIVGRMMAPLLKLRMTRLMHRTLRDLKHYAETGRPHPGKTKAKRPSGRERLSSQR